MITTYKLPPDKTKKPTTIAQNAEVISFISGLGFPRENIIPNIYFKDIIAYISEKVNRILRESYFIYKFESSVLKKISKQF